MARKKWYYNESYMLDQIQAYKVSTRRKDRSLKDMCVKCGWVYSYYRELQKKRSRLYIATYDCIDNKRGRYYISGHGRRSAGAAEKRETSLT